MSINTLLIAGNPSRKGIKEFVEESRELGIKVFIKTSNSDLNSLINDLDVKSIPSGKKEMAKAAKNITEKVKNNEIDLQDIDSSLIEKELEAPEIDAVVVVGSQRLQNAALWGTSYSEYFFLDKLTEKSVKEICEEFKERSRRFGR